MKMDIEKFRPCKDGKEWYSQQKSSIEAWNDCPRGDWMLWIAMKLGVDRKKLILIGAKCANTVRHLMKDERNTTAVDTAIAYGEGRATEEEFEKARSEAYDAYIAADAAMAAYIAASAAARAASAAARAAYYAAATAAAAAAARAAFHAAGESQEAQKANQLETANICREILTDDIIKIIEK